VSDRAGELRCSSCGCDVECCAFCDEVDCPSAACYRCVTEALGEAMAQPHAHGG